MIDTQQNPSIDVDAVLESLKVTILDVDAYYYHAQAGTLDQYYSTTIDNFIHDLMVVPINRSLLDMEIDDDPEHVGLAVEDAAKNLAHVFHKSQQKVEQDLTDSLGKLPLDDLREARLRRHLGRLN